LWGRYMTELGWVEKTAFLHQERRLMELYAEGRLAMEDYMDFSLAPIAGRTPAISASAHFLVSAIGRRLGVDEVLAIDIE
ncbi:HAD family hydrolase, partial [Pseudomonas aeruginosa]